MRILAVVIEPASARLEKELADGPTSRRQYRASAFAAPTFTFSWLKRHLAPYLQLPLLKSLHFLLIQRQSQRENIFTHLSTMPMYINALY